MSKISSAKLIGGIGALLMIIGWVVPLGPIIGLVLLFVAVRYIADETKDSSIFDDYLMHFIFTIIAIVAMFLLMFIAIGGFSFFTAVQSITTPEEIWALLEPRLAGIVAALLIGWAFFCIGAWYLKKSYDKVAEDTKVNLFKTTALIYFIGALTVVVAIGFLIIVIAKIIEIIAYFSLPDNIPTKKDT